MFYIIKYQENEMDLEGLSKKGRAVKFVFSELNESYENGTREEIAKWEDISSACLFWYYIEMGSVIVEYKEEKNDEYEKILLEQLEKQFNEMGNSLRRLTKIRECRTHLYSG